METFVGFLSSDHLGTLGQWAAPFITWGLNYRGAKAAGSGPADVDKQVSAIVDKLGGRRVYLLKCIELRQRRVPVTFYACCLLKFEGFECNRDLAGWEAAARYACDFLSLLNLVKYTTSDEVAITDLGMAFLESKPVLQAFSQELQLASSAC